MKTSLEFYTKVLGGEYSVVNERLYGEPLQYILFEKEEKLQETGRPKLKENLQQLDAIYIFFGSMNIELLQYRDSNVQPEQNNTGLWSAKHSSSSFSIKNNMYVNFKLKDNVDLEEFVDLFENEAISRGMKNVGCNRITNTGKIVKYFSFSGDYTGLKVFIKK
jgi:hypothetical protein